MNTGIFGEGFPYSNFHDLNMDWIIKIAKDFLDQYSNIQQIITDGEESLQNLIEQGGQELQELTSESLTSLQNKADALETALQNWYDTHSQDIADELASALADLNDWYTTHEHFLDTYVSNAISTFNTEAQAIGDQVIASIPADYTTLATEVADLLEWFNELNDLLFKDEATITGILLTQGGCIKTVDGTINYFPGNLNWSYSDYIKIPAGARRIKSNAQSSGSGYGIAFYDSTKTFISGYDHYVTFDISIPENAVYYRFTDTVEDEPHPYITYYETPIDVVSNGFIKITDINWNEGGAIRTDDGTVQSFPGFNQWQYTDYIPIPTYAKSLKTNAISPGSAQGIAFYDASKTFISDSGVNYYYEATLPIKEEYKYLRMTNNTNDQADPIFIEFRSIYLSKYIYDGIGDFAEAIKTGVIIKGHYYLHSSVTIPEGRTIIGDTCTVEINDNAHIDMQKGSALKNIKFTGTWNPTREHGDGETYTQFGYIPLISLNDLATGNTDALFGQNKTQADAFITILTEGAYNTCIDSCRFENIDRLVILASGQRHETNNNAIVSNCFFTDCRMGVYLLGEFARVYANQYLRCIVACYLKGGNTNNFGEIIKGCDCGYYFPIDAVAHNEITSMECAHCGLAGVYARALGGRLGCTIVGSQFADAPVIGTNVHNLLIIGCRLDTFFDFTGSSCSIVCNNVGNGYLYERTDIYTVPTDTNITLNRGLDIDDSLVNN